MNLDSRPQFIVETGAPYGTQELFDQLIGHVAEQPDGVPAQLATAGQTLAEIGETVAGLQADDASVAAEALRTYHTIFRGEHDLEVEFDKRVDDATASEAIHLDRAEPDLSRAERRERLRITRVRMFLGDVATWAKENPISDVPTSPVVAKLPQAA